MTDNQFTYVNIISSSGKKYEFREVRDFQVNIKAGMLVVKSGEGEFCFFLNHLRYSEAGPVTRNEQPGARPFDIVLTPVLPDQAPEVLHVPDMINYDWKADIGILMVFGKDRTLIFHMDHVISYGIA